MNRLAQRVRVAASHRKYSNWPYLKDEHRMVYKMCRDFADTELTPIAAKLDKQHLYPKEQIQKLGELGIISCILALVFV